MQLIHAVEGWQENTYCNGLVSGGVDLGKDVSQIDSRHILHYVAHWAALIV